MFNIVAKKDGYNSVLCTDGQFREECAIGGKSWTGKVFKIKGYKSEKTAKRIAAEFVMNCDVIEF